MYILVKSDGDLILQDCDNMHAFAIVLYDWVRETINGPKALDEQLHHHATGH